MSGAPLGKAFGLFRNRVLTAAVVVTAASGLGLLALNVWATPSPDFQANTYSGPISPGLFSLIQTLLSVLLSIGVISLIYERFLHESYASDLARFLNLETAIVNSGLQDIAQDRTIDWDNFLAESSSVDALLREPQRWFMAHIDAVLDAARHRPVKMTIGLPDPDSSQFPVMAHLAGLSEDALSSRIQTAIDELEAKFDDASEELRPGTVIEVVQYPDPLAYELVFTEERVAVMMGHISSPKVGENRATFAFRPSGSHYPSSWWRPQLDVLKSLDPICHKEKR